LFRDYPEKQKILPEIRAAAFDGIELFAGQEVRRKIEEAGMPLLHRYYPAEHVDLLQTYITERTTRSVIRWSANLGRQCVGIDDDFHVQDLLIVRLHYPHNEPAARVTDVKTSDAQLLKAAQTAGQGVTAVSLPRSTFGQLARTAHWIAERVARRIGRGTGQLDVLVPGDGR
jgi:hypothetical protein